MATRAMSSLIFGPVGGEENLPRLPHVLNIATVAMEHDVRRCKSACPLQGTSTDGLQDLQVSAT